ncbi:MAG: undecaprenyldiphospho-muramoylpentapeptide beta-N-acetylglucosaminyltransferase [Elusimicrobia bacterium]|nr:undecaprenyldiphospho-muramoylpentapeptide beta-N-acetylglucosaminyltransferase [Elusimicrobiota bacterium]
MPEKNKIIIASGGTGGHLIPAIVLAKELQKRGYNILFTIRKDDPSRQILLKEGFNFLETLASPFLGQNLNNSFKNLFLNFIAFFQGIGICSQFKANGAIGFGAYTSVPLVTAAFIKGIPILLHEQNLIPGLANRFCAPLAKKIAISFIETEKYFPGKSFYTGNLIRQEFFEKITESTKNLFLKSLLLSSEKITILVFGGSLGAKTINACLIEILPQLKLLKEKIQFIHLSGRDEETSKLKEKYSHFQIPALIQNFSTEMAQLYQCADFCIARSGASTIAELIQTQTPAILIPYPFAAKNHQAKNGEILQNLGAAKVILESPSFSQELYAAIIEMVESKEKRMKMKEAYKKITISPQNAAIRFADAITDIINSI